MNENQKALEIPQGHDGWGVLELLGHRKRPGKLSPAMQYGAPCVRVDIPYQGAVVTEYYFPGSIYAIRPCTKEYAEAEAEYCTDLRPIQHARLLPLIDPEDIEPADDDPDFREID